MELIVGCHEPLLAGEGLTRDGQPLVVIEKIGRRFLQRVERRHEKPHLIEVGEAEYLPRQAYVPYVHGVETASENAYAEVALAVGHGG